ncbi:MAG TPA: NTP transferase domain-containing protein, partial [Saprospiraceae bacterium]|nr:NTP transferase domain-containing protein [Saprospiraceae bacterium]
ARAGQQIDSAVQVLTDTFADLGPYGAILSAFRSQPDAAWLVVACDLPLLDAETLRFLADNRAVGATATAFRSPHDDMPEPLIAIWEPKSYAQLLSFLAQGYSCPRKVLLNTDTRLLDAPRAAALTNVNTPEELEKLGFNLLEL